MELPYACHLQKYMIFKILLHEYFFPEARKHLCTASMRHAMQITRQISTFYANAIYKCNYFITF